MLQLVLRLCAGSSVVWGMFVVMSDSPLVKGCHVFLFFFFNDTATTEIYTLSLHDALPISIDPQRDRFGLSGLEADFGLLNIIREGANPSDRLIDVLQGFHPVRTKIGRAHV